MIHRVVLVAREWTATLAVHCGCQSIAPDSCYMTSAFIEIREKTTFRHQEMIDMVRLRACMENID